MKPIEDFPGYFIDESGTIFSYWKKGGSKSRRKEPRILKHRILDDGRHMIMLSKETRKYYRYVHQLVLMTFVGPRPTGMLACHGPNGVADNSVSNLYWGTEAQNNLDDKIRDGTIRWGEKHNWSKLNSLQVRIIRRCYALGKDCGITQSYLSSIFSVGQDHISRIISRRDWKYC